MEDKHELEKLNITSHDLMKLKQKKKMNEVRLAKASRPLWMSFFGGVMLIWAGSFVFENNKKMLKVIKQTKLRLLDLEEK